MEVLKAIYQRRATRHFSDAAVPKGVVHELLRAAVQAPSALNHQPWAFGVFHGRERLKAYSERAKTLLMATTEPSFGLDPRIDQYGDLGFNVYHGADTLIVIFAKPGRYVPTEDCFLAAQNLMLAACGFGLGSCPVGFTRPWFNLPDVKTELGIPDHYSAALPIVIGYPDSAAPAVARRDPEFACWHWDE